MKKDLYVNHDYRVAVTRDSSDLSLHLGMLTLALHFPTFQFGKKESIGLWMKIVLALRWEHDWRWSWGVVCQCILGVSVVYGWCENPLLDRVAQQVLDDQGRIVGVGYEYVCQYKRGG